MIVNSVDINGKEYDEIDIIIIDNIKYAYLVNTNDNTDLLIQRIVIKDNEEYYEPLSSKEEFDKALIHFSNKHKDILKNS